MAKFSKDEMYDDEIKRFNHKKKPKKKNDFLDDELEINSHSKEKQKANSNRANKKRDKDKYNRYDDDFWN